MPSAKMNPKVFEFSPRLAKIKGTDKPLSSVFLYIYLTHHGLSDL